MQTETLTSKSTQPPTAEWSLEWWKDFLDKTDYFKKSITIPNVLSEDDVRDFNYLTLSALREIFIRENTQYDFRLYLEGVYQDKENLKHTLFKHVPHEEDTPESWVNRVFPNGEKFAVIINSGEKFSNELAERIAQYFAPMIELTGIPLKGLNITIFVGNYGYTPLGIHKDHPGEHVMHLHLGPGDKTMYNWEMAEYEEMTGNAQNNKDILPLLPYADRYDFGTRDIYFMPWNKYHIGNTEEFSVGISVWFNHMPFNKLLPNMLSSIRIQNNLPKDSPLEQIVSPFNDVAVNGDFEQICSALNMDDNVLSQSFEQIVKENYQNFILALASNQGWKTIPIPRDKEVRDEKVEDEPVDLLAFRDKIIVTTPPFKVKYKVLDNGTMYLFARGNKIELKHHPEVTKLLDALNIGREVNTLNLLKGINEFWPEEAGLYIIYLLYNHRAIKILS